MLSNSFKVTLILLTLLSLCSCKKEETVEEVKEEVIEEAYHYQEEYLKVDGFHYYYDDEKYTSKLGIDVSVFQDDIDFEKVKADGYEFVYIRLGYRGKDEGLLHLDSNFENYYRQAKDAGLDVGIYFFSQALNTYEAKEEANFVLEQIKDLELDLPIALDYEEPYSSRIEILNGKQRSDNALAFLDTIKNNNYEVIVYTNEDWLDVYYNKQIYNYPIWFAQYNVNFPTIYQEYYMWQYSNVGEVDGIEGYVDIDLMFIQKSVQP